MAHKIKPKNFQKRIEQSKTFKEWNEENGSSRAYSTTSKRKTTILDECESDYKKSPTLNQNPRLDGSENIAQAVLKISNGNICASVPLFQVFSDISEYEAISCLLSLDSLGIYGDNVYKLYDMVDDDPKAFTDLIRDIIQGNVSIEEVV
jgi:hypothetical protein